MQDLASQFLKFFGGNTPGPSQWRQPLPHPTPTPAYRTKSNTVKIESWDVFEIKTLKL